MSFGWWQSRMAPDWSRPWRWPCSRASQFLRPHRSWWGAFAGFIGAFGIAALYRALAVGRMGVVAPVAAVVTGVLPVLLGTYTDGMPDRLQLGGFALALVSIWLLAGSNETANSRKGIGLAALAGVMFGLFLIAGKQAGAPRNLLAAGSGARGFNVSDGCGRVFPAARSASAGPSAVGDGAIRPSGLGRQRTLHCCDPTWTPRRRRRVVVALSRDYRDACTRSCSRSASQSGREWASCAHSFPWR